MVEACFHDALILSIVKVTKENEIGIFEFIKLMISETNWILSPGARDFGPSPVAIYVQTHINGGYSYPLISQSYHRGTFRERNRKLYRDCLVNIHEILNGDWEEVSWYDFLTYILFIQSNCHHKGNPNFSKLCRNSDSFLNFFYKSKSAFNPWSQWELSDLQYTPVMEYIKETKTAEFRGEWWVNAFKREKEIFLMFETLAPSNSLGVRFTTGWVVRGINGKGGDILPSGHVINQLRDNYNLPSLTGDYGLGCISRDLHYEYKGEDKEEKEENELFNFCDFVYVSIGLVIISKCISKRGGVFP